VQLRGDPVRGRRIGLRFDNCERWDGDARESTGEYPAFPMGACTVLHSKPEGDGRSRTEGAAAKAGNTMCSLAKPPVCAGHGFDFTIMCDESLGPEAPWSPIEGRKMLTHKRYETVSSGAEKFTNFFLPKPKIICRRLSCWLKRSASGPNRRSRARRRRSRPWAQRGDGGPSMKSTPLESDLITPARIQNTITSMSIALEDVLFFLFSFPGLAGTPARVIGMVGRLFPELEGPPFFPPMGGWRFRRSFTGRCAGRR